MLVYMSHYGRGASTQVDATTHGPYRRIVAHEDRRDGRWVGEVLECGHRGNQWPERRNAAEVHAEWVEWVEVGMKVARKRRCYTCLQVANRG